MWLLAFLLAVVFLRQSTVSVWSSRFGLLTNIFPHWLHLKLVLVLSPHLWFFMASLRVKAFLHVLQVHTFFTIPISFFVSLCFFSCAFLLWVLLIFYSNSHKKMTCPHFAEEYGSSYAWLGYPAYQMIFRHFTLCLFRLSSWLVLNPQELHCNWIGSVCVFTCLSKLAFHRNFFSQKEHWKQDRFASSSSLPPRKKVVT